MVDYSKWREIELSSDEDDVHPFIETSTLFRMRHENRLKKMEERQRTEFTYECRKASWSKRFREANQSLQNFQNEEKDITPIQQQLHELEAEKKELILMENTLKKKVPWYIDTICQPGFSKTSVCSLLLESTKIPENYDTFLEKNNVHLKQFAFLKTFDDNQKFLIVHRSLIQRSTLYFLISYGIRLYLKQKTSKLGLVCRQIVLLLHVLELFKIYQQASKELLVSFFSSIKSSEKHFKEEFKQECEKVEDLIGKLVTNEENVSDSTQENSPTASTSTDSAADVFENLPENLKEAFVRRDREALAEALLAMSPQEAQECMLKCTEAGLWVQEGAE